MGKYNDQKIVHSMLLKFGKKENLLKLQKGQLYMKNLNYYRELEEEEDNDCIGDKQGGQLVQQNLELNLYEEKNGLLYDSIIANKTTLDFNRGFFPVFSMFSADERNTTFIEVNEDLIIGHVKFSEEQKKNLSSFEDSVLIIFDSSSFRKLINSVFTEKEYSYREKIVEYAPENSKEEVQLFTKYKGYPYIKRKKYEYQQEYRFLIEMEVDDFKSVEIGDISDISIIYDAPLLLEQGFSYLIKKG